MLDDDLAAALASGLHFEWDDDERELLVPLVDATIMRVECERLEEIARPVAAAVWDGLRPLLVGELEEQARRQAFVAEALEDALADLELGPRRSDLVVAVLQQAAVDLADDVFFLEECLDCIEDGLGHAAPPARPALVERAAAVLALHRAADFGSSPPHNAERRAARERVGAMAALGRQSLPRLSRALAALVEGPLPAIEDDRVLAAVVKRRLAVDAHLN
jgi:hypothetical protein